MNNTSYILRFLSLIPACALVIFCLSIAIYAFYFRSVKEFYELKNLNLSKSSDLIHMSKFFPGSEAVLEVASQLHGDQFDASNKKLHLLALPLPFDRLVPNAINIQWVGDLSQLLSISDIANTSELTKAIKNDDRPIGNYIRRSKDWNQMVQSEWALINGLNNIIRNGNLSDSEVSKDLTLDDRTLALTKYSSEFITKPIINELILQKSYPDIIYSQWIEDSDVLSWSGLLGDLNNSSNEVTLLIKNTLLCLGYKLPNIDSTPSIVERQTILLTLNYLIRSDTLLISDNLNTSFFLNKQISKALKKKIYGKNLMILNRWILQSAMPSTIRPSKPILSSNFDYSPYYPSIPIRSDLGEITIINTEPFLGSISVKDGIWYRPAIKFYTKIKDAKNLIIPFSDDFAKSKEVFFRVSSSFGDDLTFDALAPNTHVVSDESWIVTNKFYHGWNAQLPIKNHYWKPIMVKGEYGKTLSKFPILPTSSAKWIGRNLELANSKDIYYRKIIKLHKVTTGELIISGINRYELFLNGVLIGRGEHWNIPGRHTVTLKEGDIIGVHLSIDDERNDALLIDFKDKNSEQWSKSSVIAGYSGNRIYLKKQINDLELEKAKKNGHLEINELQKYLINGREFYYFISPFDK
jgi:hypothetical protein